MSELVVPAVHVYSLSHQYSLLLKIQFGWLEADRTAEDGHRSIRRRRRRRRGHGNCRGRQPRRIVPAAVVPEKEDEKNMKVVDPVFLAFKRVACATCEWHKF